MVARAEDHRVLAGVHPKLEAMVHRELLRQARELHRMTDAFGGVPISRREALRRSVYGSAGLLLMEPLGVRASESKTVKVTDGKAKSVIQIWLWGGPCHIDTFDPKPDAGRAYTGALDETVGMDGPVAAQQAMLTMPTAVDRTLTVERLFKDFEKLGVTVSDIEYEDADAILRVPIEAPRPSASALATAAMQVIRAELNGPVDRVRIVATKEDEDYWEIVLEKEDLLRSVSLTGSPIALVEPPDPKWLGLFPEPDPTAAAFFEEAEPVESKDRLRRVAEQVFAELDRQVEPYVVR